MKRSLERVVGCATPKAATGVVSQKGDLDEDEVQEGRMEPWSVFISDMNGFSKLTREEFFSQLRRMEPVALPVLERHQVELVKQYGDDPFIVSKDPSRVVAVARCSTGAGT